MAKSLRGVCLRCQPIHRTSLSRSIHIGAASRRQVTARHDGSSSRPPPGSLHTPSCGQLLTRQLIRPALSQTAHAPPSPRPRAQRRALHLPAAIEIPIETLTTALHSLHGAVSHLPPIATITSGGGGWALTLVLFAAALNLSLRLPSKVYLQYLSRRRLALLPVLRARAAVAHRTASQQQEVARQQQQRGQLTGEAVVATAREKLHARESTRLYARLGVQEWRAYPGIAAGLAGWLAGTETVRRTCGGGVGLLGSVFGRDGSGTEGSIVGAAADAAVDAATIVVDPSLSTGGLLWFPDLLSPDPLHVLPLAFSALLLLNAWPRDAETLRRVFAVGSSSSVGAGAASPSASLLARLALRRTLLLLAIAAGPVTMHLPAAMHVFWVGSAGWAYLQNRIVEWVFPAKADKADEMLKRGTENGGPTDRWYVRPPLPEDEPARKV